MKDGRVNVQLFFENMSKKTLTSAILYFSWAGALSIQSYASFASVKHVTKGLLRPKSVFKVGHK